MINNVYILCGASGAGKTYLANQLKDYFNVVDYDKNTMNSCKEQCLQFNDKPHLLVTPIQAKRIFNELTSQGVPVSCVYLKEERDVIIGRLKMRGKEVTPTLDKRLKRYDSLEHKFKLFDFVGTQGECKGWLIEQIR